MGDQQTDVTTEKKAPEKTLSKKGEERKRKLIELRKQRRQAAKRAKQFYCHYCDCFLPNHSERIRKEHQLSPKHIDNHESYFGKFIKEKNPGLLERTLEEVKQSHQLLSAPPPPAPLRINIPTSTITQPMQVAAGGTVAVRVGSPSIRIGHAGLEPASTSSNSGKPMHT
jgi:hypothetical protein